MIIRSPTGLYNVADLANNPDTNITYTISMSKLSKDVGTISKLPTGVVSRSVPLSLVTDRNRLGSLAYSVANSNNGTVGINNTIYEVGQVLEFGEISVIQQSLPKSGFEIRHDTSSIDYESLGLNSESASISQAADTKFKALVADYNKCKSERAGIDVDIATTLKNLSDAKKARSAVVLLDSPDILAKLDSLITELNDRGVLLVQSATNLNNLISDIELEIRQVSQLVR